MFKPQDVADYLEFSRYIREAFRDYKKSVYIAQTTPDKLDFIFMVEKDPTTILKVNDLSCRPDAVAGFFKKQPKDKPILLLAHLLQNADSFATLLVNDPAEAELIHPIQIHSWNGKAFGENDAAD
ncbi:MAG: hypothetical protein JST81_00435 [Bacteroidetes bacterium]|nr:hypothetical protein [Bacteroidota bacterium]